MNADTTRLLLLLSPASTSDLFQLTESDWYHQPLRRRPMYGVCNSYYASTRTEYVASFPLNQSISLVCSEVDVSGPNFEWGKKGSLEKQDCV